MYLHVLLVLPTEQTAVKFFTGLTRASISMELHNKDKFYAGKAR